MNLSSTQAPARKKVYAVLWIDDFGALRPKKRDIRWYHQNAGPISFAIECDERFPWGFDLAFKSRAQERNAQDFFSHHLHLQRYIGARLPKKVYDKFRLHCLVWSALRYFTRFTMNLRFRSVIGVLLSTLFVVAALLIHAFFFALLTLIGLYAAFAVLVATWYYVRRPSNWQYFFDDRAAIEQQIKEAEAEFRERGLRYPCVVRHGWNLPWQESMQFYQQLGVFADASAVPSGADKHPHKGNRAIDWTLTQPYYASRTHDYNVAWDGKNNSDKGLLELPVNLGNIAIYGFGENEQRLVRRIPNGGLVSCYIHPQDDFAPVKAWVTHLKENYDVHFVSAKGAARIFSTCIKIDLADA